MKNWAMEKKQFLRKRVPKTHLVIPVHCRLLGVPTVTDRLLQQAVSQVLMPKYEQ